jgi:hypothetical protein
LVGFFILIFILFIYLFFFLATLQKYTGYTYEDIFPCIVEMKGTVKKAPLLKTQAIFKKYSDSKYLKAATVAVEKI